MAEMADDSWLRDLAFLVDITTRMNELITRLQRKIQHVSEIYNHIKGFMNKLRLWHANIQNAILSHFPTLKWECVQRRTPNLQINLKNCLINFRFALKTSTLKNIYLKYSSKNAGFYNDTRLSCASFGLARIRSNFDFLVWSNGKL